MSNNQAPAAVEKKKPRMTGKQFASTYGSLVALVVLVIVFFMLKHQYLSPSNLRNLLRIASITL